LSFVSILKSSFLDQSILRSPLPSWVIQHLFPAGLGSGHSLTDLQKKA
jgi:hypothetical protein